MLWSKNMQLIDANVILRYLLNDNRDMSQKAREVVSSGAYTKPEIIAEVVYVLSGVYQAARSDIQAYVKEMLRFIRCTERDAVVYAMDVYASTSLDFVDCLLVAYQALNKEAVFTFDKKLLKHLAKKCVQLGHIRRALQDAINRLPKSWDCCSRYMECSNAKRCVHPDPSLALECGYRKILASGKIYYGENRNVD